MKNGLKVMMCTFLLSSCLFLYACGNKGIVGMWTSDVGEYTYEFKEDGTGSYSFGNSKMDFTYTIEDNTISILYNGNTKAFKTEFSISGNKMNVKDSTGNDTFYTRK